MQAGFEPAPGTAYLDVEDVGWGPRRRVFTDLQEREIRNIFKLYPWEWLVRERFGPHLLETDTRWLEPPWKMLLSNKALLPLLWRLYGDDPGKKDLVLRAYFTEDELAADGVRRYVRKPLLSREGANVRVVEDGRTVLETEGPYGDGPWVYQELYDLPDFDGNYPVLGSWVVNGWACGLGIREDSSRVTQNTSRFVPHLFRPG
jgi:glutathionylspermidine synthase